MKTHEKYLKEVEQIYTLAIKDDESKKYYRELIDIIKRYREYLDANNKVVTPTMVGNSLGHLIYSAVSEALKLKESRLVNKRIGKGRPL